MNPNDSNFQHSLKGFSGYQLEIRRTEKINFVRKSARELQQNAKLKSEINKLSQLDVIAINTKLFHVPRLLHFGENNEGLFYYDIEFIPSWELATYIPRIEPRQIEHIATVLVAIIDSFANTQKLVIPILAEEAFICGKLNETGEKLLSSYGIYSTDVDKLIDQYAELVAGLQIPSTLLPNLTTFCHGDLALDNVLINRNGEIYIIDPLSNGHESFMWDVSKVLQSSLLNWHQIKHSEFSLDLTYKRIHLSVPERMILFNTHFTTRIGQKIDNRTTILYLATTMARVMKYFKTYEQLSAMLLITNTLLTNYYEERCSLDEPFGPMRG